MTRSSTTSSGGGRIRRTASIRVRYSTVRITTFRNWNGNGGTSGASNGVEKDAAGSIRSTWLASGDLRSSAITFLAAYHHLELRVIATRLAWLQDDELVFVASVLPAHQSVCGRLDPENVGAGVKVPPLKEVRELVRLIPQDHAPGS